MNKKMNKKNKGFSLVELIIVIAIMAILAGVLAPQFVKYLNNSKVSADIDTAQTIATSIAAQYAQDAVDGGSIVKKEQLKEITSASTDDIKNKVLGDLPASKVKPGSAYYYYVDANGLVTIYIGDTGKSSTSDVKQLYPKADPNWK